MVDDSDSFLNIKDLFYVLLLIIHRFLVVEKEKLIFNLFFLLLQMNEC